MRDPAYVQVVTCNEVDLARAIASWLGSPLAERVTSHIDSCEKCASQSTCQPSAMALPTELRELQEADWDDDIIARQIVECARSEYPQVRLALLIMLAHRVDRLRSSRRWVKLAQILSDPAHEPDVEVRRVALASLCELARRPKSGLSEAADDGHLQSEINGLLRALDDPSMLVRQAAIQALADVIPLDQRAEVVLVRTLDPGYQPDADVRRDALVALSDRGEPTGPPLDAIRAALAQDPSWHVRRAAARALGQTFTDGVTAALVARSMDEADDEVLAMIAQALGQGGRPERTVTVALQRLVDSPSALVRGAAATALARRGDMLDIQDLAQILTADDPATRRGALHGVPTTVLDAPAVLDIVAAALQDDDASIRASAIVALSRASSLPEGVRQQIASLSDDSAQMVREAASQTLRVL